MVHFVQQPTNIQLSDLILGTLGILDTGIYTLNRTPVIRRALTTSFTSRGNLNLNSHTQHLFRRWKETRESGGKPLRHREKLFTQTITRDQDHPQEPYTTRGNTSNRASVTHNSIYTTNRR